MRARRGAMTDVERLEAKAEWLESERRAWLCNDPECTGMPHRSGCFPEDGCARDTQRPPDWDWDWWLLIAGRGFGKTRVGAEWVWRKALQLGPESRGALIGPTAADTRDVLVLGESGIMACTPPQFRPVYEPSNRRLIYPNGAVQMCYSADEPDRLRGPQHHYLWADEWAAWRRLQYAWDMALMGLRLGQHPQAVITTTPRPLPLLKDMLKDERAAITRGSTYDNLDNLAPTFREAVVKRYEGTTLGRQELYADVLDDLPGALLSRTVLDANRVETGAEPQALLRVVAMDPAGTGAGDETGLIAGYWGADGHAYVTHDWSAKLTPEAATRRAWDLFDHVGADVLVYEDNFGKGWVKEVMGRAWSDRGHQGNAPLQEIHASAGKQLRAQPVVMRHEQGLIHHVGDFPELEDQYCTWMPDDPQQRTRSPDRVDAAVHLDAFLTQRFVKNIVQITSPIRRARERGLNPATGPSRRVGR